MILLSMRLRGPSAGWISVALSSAVVGLRRGKGIERSFARTFGRRSETGPRIVSMRSAHRRERIGANPLAYADQFPFRRRPPTGGWASNQLQGSVAKISGRSEEARLPADDAALRGVQDAFRHQGSIEHLRETRDRRKVPGVSAVSGILPPSRRTPVELAVIGPWQGVQLGAGCRASCMALPSARPSPIMNPIRPCAKAALARPEDLRGGSETVYDPPQIVAA